MTMALHIRTHTGYYLQAEQGGGHAVTARGPWPREWETLTLLPDAGEWADVANGTRVRLRAPHGQYVAARGAEGVLDATAQDRAAPETLFTVVLLPGEPRHLGHFSRFALRAGNGRYVCAEGGGDGIVVANRTQIGPWETFEAHLHPEPADACLTTGIRTSSDIHFLQALDGGGGELSARGSWSAAWETFDIVAADRAARGFPDGARVNIRTDSWHYLQAQNGGGGQVTAAGPWPREWETFRLVVPGRRPWLRPGGTFGLRAPKGQYVEAPEDPVGAVTATATTPSPRGLFTAATVPAYKSPMHQYVGTATDEETTSSTAFARLRGPGHSIPTARTGTFLAQLVAEARTDSPGASLEVRVLVDGEVAHPGPAVLTGDTAYAGCSYAAWAGPVQPGAHTVDVDWRVTNGRGYVRKLLFAVSVVPD